MARPTPRLGLHWRWASGLGWEKLAWQTQHAGRPNTKPQSHPLKTGKRSGTAAPNRPHTDQKRSVRAAENGASESGKTKPLQGLGWPGLGWLAWAGLGLGWAGLGGWSQRRQSGTWAASHLRKIQNDAPEPPPQNGETQRHGGPKQAKNGPKTRPSRGRKRHI